MTTTNEITDTEIRTLRREAALAGDFAQVDLCCLALDGDDSARAECAAVIADARAQDEEQEDETADLIQLIFVTSALSDLKERVEELEAIARRDGRTTDELIDMTSLPTFGGDEPAGSVGVWSWDEDSLLVGTCTGDWKIVLREQA